MVRKIRRAKTLKLRRAKNLSVTPRLKQPEFSRESTKTNKFVKWFENKYSIYAEDLPSRVKIDKEIDFETRDKLEKWLEKNRFKPVSNLIFPLDEEKEYRVEYVTAQLFTNGKQNIIVEFWDIGEDHVYFLKKRNR